MQTKTSAERTFEALTWAAVVIWLGFILVINALGEQWLIMMMLGIILLSSAIYQRSRNWDTSLAIWIFGIWMAVFSVIEIVNEIVRQVNGTEGLNITLGVYLGIALVSMGVAAILRMIQGPKIGPDVPGNISAGGYGSTSGRTSYGPREYDAGHTYRDGQGYSTQYDRAALDDRRRDPRDRDFGQRSQYGDDLRNRDYDQPSQYGRDPARTGGRDDYGYDQPRTQPAPRDDYGYQGTTPARRGYDPGYERQPQGDYDYDEGYADDYDQYDYYDEPEWDAAPQMQQYQPQEPRRRRPQAAEGPADIDARVEEIIRRSRQRRSDALQANDLPADDLPY